MKNHLIFLTLFSTTIASAAVLQKDLPVKLSSGDRIVASTSQKDVSGGKVLVDYVAETSMSGSVTISGSFTTRRGSAHSAPMTSLVHNNASFSLSKGDHLTIVINPKSAGRGSRAVLVDFMAPRNTSFLGSVRLMGR